MKSIKKIIGMLFAVCVIISSFSVLSFAADDTFQPDRSLGDQCYKVEFISSLDEEEGKTYIEDSLISIYKVPDDAIISSEFINNTYLYSKVTTDKEGKATASVVPGTYIVKENNFRHDGKEYQAEYLTFKVTEESNFFTVYFKHSLVTHPNYPDVPSDNPHTGDDMWPMYLAIGLGCASIVCIIILSRKVKRLDKTEAK